MNKLSPNSAGAMFGSPQRCRPPLLNTDKGQLSHIWFSPTAKQVERHHFSCLPFAVRNHMHFRLFSIFSTFSILDPMVSYLSTTAHFFDILIPVVAQHHLSGPPMLVYTSVSYVVAPTSLSLAFGPTGKKRLGILRQPRWSLQTRQYAMECGQWTF